MLYETADRLLVDDLNIGTSVIVISTTRPTFDEWVDTFTGVISAHERPSKTVTVTIAGYQNPRTVTLQYADLGFDNNEEPILALVPLSMIDKYRCPPAYKLGTTFPIP